MWKWNRRNQGTKDSSVRSASRSRESSGDKNVSSYPEYRDPYGETQEAIFALVSSDPRKSFTVSELATVAVEFGPVDRCDLAYSAAMGLRALGLVEVNSADRTVSLSRKVDAKARL